MKRWRYVWHALTGPLPEAQADKRRHVRDRYLRQIRRRRVWRQRSQRLRWIDPGKPPLTVLRWLSILGIALAWWAQGAATSTPRSWVPFVVIAGVLILPDVAGFAVGGLRLDLRQAQDEIAKLHQEVNAQARASSMSILAVGDSAIAKVTDDLTREALSVAAGQASGKPVPWRASSSSEHARSTARQDGT